MPKKGSRLLLSVSIVNLIKEWHWFRILRKLSADAFYFIIIVILLEIIKVVGPHKPIAIPIFNLLYQVKLCSYDCLRFVGLLFHFFFCQEGAGDWGGAIYRLRLLVTS